MVRRRGKSLLSICLCLVFLLGTAQINAAWDGYSEEEEGGQILLVDTENMASIMASGAVPSTEFVRGGRYSTHWTNHTQTKTISFNNVARDWSQCSSIQFDVYSAKATKGSIGFMVYCDYVPTPGKTISYQLYRISLDWEGWKTIVIPLSSFITGNFADWAKVNRMQFLTDSWSCTADPESDLYITSVYGNVGGEEVEEDSGVKSMQVSESGKRAVYESLAGETLVMNFAFNAISDGRMISLSAEERITTAEGVSFAPTGFFSKVLGAEVSVQASQISIQLSGHSLTATVGQKNYTVDGEPRTFSATPLAEDGIVYLPLAESAVALGKLVKTNGMTTAIGAGEQVGAIFADEKKTENAEIMLNAGDGSEKEITAEDWRELKDKWREYLVGDENKDLEDEHVASVIQGIDASCKAAWDAMNRDKEAEVLFGLTAVTTTDSMTAQFNRFYCLVRAYGTYGSAYYQDETLRRDILFGFDWLYNNLYGQAEIDGTGWRDTSLFNWWDWYCGSAKALCESLLIMEDALTPGKIKQYLSLYDHLRGIMRTNMTPDNAASRVYAGTLAAALEEDYDRMQTLVDDYNLMLIPEESGNGVQEDDLYITHNYFAYSTAYGTSSLLDRLTAVEAILAGTAFEFATPYKYNSCRWLYETFEPLIFNGNMTNAQSGRSKGNEENYTAYAVIAMLDFIGAFGKDDDIRLKQMIKRDVTEANKTAIYNGLNVNQTEKLSAILADDSIQAQPYYKNKIYYTGDSVMHQRDSFGFALSMSSSRIAAWESINGNNMTGWYQGDGMLYMYVDGDPTAYNSSYWKTTNPYHLPGTTVDTQEREAVSIANSAQVLTNQDFVGAAGYEDLYATAAMQLESFHNDVEGTTSTTGSGGAAPLHNSTLMAKKAWFMFDDEVVALGADINANDGFEVQTVVENRKLNKTETLATAPTTTTSSDYPIVAITSSGSDGNVAENTIDEDYSTRWSQEGGGWVAYELESAVPIGYVGVAQYSGTEGRQAIFDLQVSNDGENWDTVWSGKASGTTNSMEAYDMKNTTAKYVRYYGYGRTNSAWNSVTEVKIYPPTADGSMPVDGSVNTDSGKILGSEVITVDGKAMEKASTWKQTFENPSWMHIEDIAGYYFPQGGNLTLDKVVNISSYLEAWFSHGVSPTKETYSYVLLPEKTAEQTAAYSQSPDIEILSNTDTLQAVLEKNLGLVGMVFWEKGNLNDITVSEPMIVMDGTIDGGREISISDPTKLLKEGTVTIAGNYTVAECDERLSVQTVGGNTVITADFDGSKGRTLVVKLNGPSPYTVNGGGQGTTAGSNANVTGSQTSSGQGATATQNTNVTDPQISSYFSDVDKNNTWAYAYIEQLAAAGIVSGDQNGYYNPKDGVTREEFLKMLMGALNLEITTTEGSGYSDVNSGDWFAPYVYTATALGLINGMGDGAFGVGQLITRQDMAVMASRALTIAGKTLQQTEEVVLTDLEQVSEYALSSVQLLAAAGVICGDENAAYRPMDSALREDAAKIIYILWKA